MAGAVKITAMNKRALPKNLDISVLKFSAKKEPINPPITKSTITKLNFVDLAEYFCFEITVNAINTSDNLPMVNGNPGIMKVNKGIPLASSKKGIKSNPKKKSFGILNIIKKKLAE